MEKEAALDLIEELDSVGEEDGEEQEDQELKRIKRLDDQEEEWLRSFVNMHPVFKEIPQRLKDEVIRRPATTSAGRTRGEGSFGRRRGSHYTSTLGRSPALRWNGLYRRLEEM